jgi:hypothetical protein
VTAFHLVDDVLAAYRDQQCGPVQRASAEAHLLACDGCRRRFAALHHRAAQAPDPAAPSTVIATSQPETDLDGVWDRVLRGVEQGPGGRPDRVLRRLGVGSSDVPVVRAVAAGAAEWSIAAAVVIATAALAAGLGGLARSWVPFVVLAPLWPPLGVAATYRFGARALAPFETTAPYPPARLLLWRTAYVLATAVPVTVAFGATIGGRGWLWASWLLPSLVCTLVVVVAATWVDPVRPAIAVAAVWTIGVLATAEGRGASPLTSELAVQATCAALAVLGALVLAQRLRHLKEMITLEVRS